MRFLLVAVLLAATPVFSQEPPNSAHATALELLQHLAEGNLEAAAAMSNAPQRRLEVLRAYRDRIGEAEFRRVYSRYFAPENRLLAEVALGPRRLLVWDLGDAGHHVAGQIYVESGGKFLLDDVPSRERAELRALLKNYR
ncbi:MAG TPA: hypothetical protein VF280_15005 [Burkholderiales bacterium]